MSTPDRSTASKSQRVLACVLCQQRKVKCDRKFPCGNCTNSQVQCVPASTLPRRQRRPRFPERELLDRLRRYESLLRQNNINFEPLHQDQSTTKQQPHNIDSNHTSPKDEQSRHTANADWVSSPSTTIQSEISYKPKNLWHAMNQRTQDSDDDGSDSSPDDVLETGVRKAWDQAYQSNDHILFGSRTTATDLSTFQPEQIHIFRLWQIYLDNVNPLLKVTHTPTLQGLIIEAASNVTNIKPTLAALMFGIYCVSVQSLSRSECQTMFGALQEELLMKYRFGCQQALLNCGFLRSTDRDCLTALYLYLISTQPGSDPHSLSSLLGLAIRIAQRMNLHNESAHAKCSALEAEMRRRLWWSLVLFDTRICEMADYKAVVLIPTWDCQTPFNVNDFDLQPDMKELPKVQGISTEALFAVVRSEMGDFVRNSAFYLDFISPALKNIAKDVQQGRVTNGGELTTLEEMIENKYLSFCNPGNSLHFMTIYTARGYLAKNHLIEHYSRFSRSFMQQTDMQRDTAISYALNMLECDTKLMTSPLTKRYLWLIQFHFPFLAYIHLCQELRRRPVGERTELIWQTMSDNYEARFKGSKEGDSPFLKLFAKVVLPAWDAHGTVLGKSEDLVIPPRIVSNVRQRLAQSTKGGQNADTGTVQNVPAMSNNGFPIRVPLDIGGQDMPHGMSGQGFEPFGIETFSDTSGQAVPDFGLNEFDWNLMDWNPMQGHGW